MYPVTRALIPETGDVFVHVIVGRSFVSKPGEQDLAVLYSMP
jgi:hypothetical protein